jgi:hypothetical protein
MGDLVVFRAAPCPEEPLVQRALVTLCQRMEKRDVVAIARYVYRNKAAPKLGILFPVCERGGRGCRIFVKRQIAAPRSTFPTGSLTAFFVSHHISLWAAQG